MCECVHKPAIYTQIKCKAQKHACKLYKHCLVAKKPATLFNLTNAAMYCIFECIFLGLSFAIPRIILSSACGLNSKTNSHLSAFTMD